MPSKGREHFDTYTVQNRVKHAILVKYLNAYFQILNSRVDAFHYIDGFAGAGTYEDEHAGSPLYAIELLVKYPNRGTASFVENDPRLFKRLEATIASRSNLGALLQEPLLRRSEFSDCLDEFLERPVFRRLQRVATFAFVDPCGLKGLYLNDLAKILGLPYAECLIFLNYDGLSRWVGGVRAGTHARDRLDRFFGGSAAAAEALACLDSNASSREADLLAIYVSALRQNSGAKFMLPFRFRAKNRNRTSHYLIHLSQHELAFKIMKEVMRSESSETDDYGSFGLIPEEEIAGQGVLFRPNAEQARTEILKKLRKGPQPVRLFVEKWPLRPNDMLVAKEYQEILLELEAEQRIEVFNGKTGASAPAGTRRKHLGKPTIGQTYHLRLSG